MLNKERWNEKAAKLYIFQRNNYTNYLYKKSWINSKTFL